MQMLRGLYDMIPDTTLNLHTNPQKIRREKIILKNESYENDYRDGKYFE